MRRPSLYERLLVTGAAAFNLAAGPAVAAQPQEPSQLEERVEAPEKTPEERLLMEVVLENCKIRFYKNGAFETRYPSAGEYVSVDDSSDEKNLVTTVLTEKNEFRIYKNCGVSVKLSSSYVNEIVDSFFEEAYDQDETQSDPLCETIDTLEKFQDQNKVLDGMLDDLRDDPFFDSGYEQKEQHKQPEKPEYR